MSHARPGTWRAFEIVLPCVAPTHPPIRAEVPKGSAVSGPVSLMLQEEDGGEAEEPLQFFPGRTHT